MARGVPMGPFDRRSVLKGMGAAAAFTATGGVLAACSSDEDDGQASAQESEGGGSSGSGGGVSASSGSSEVDLSGVEGGKRIGVVGFDTTSAAPAIGLQTLDETKGDIDWEFEIFNPAGDPTAIAGGVQDFVTAGVDAIYAWVAPGVLFGEAAAPAVEAGIPVIGVFTGDIAGLVARVEPSEWISEARIAEYLTQRMGFEGEIALLNFEQIEPLIVREAMLKAILDRYPDISVVEDLEIAVPGQIDDAAAKTAAFLGAHPNLKCIWGGWDEPALGANQAVRESGRDDVFVVGLDGIPPALEAIRAGDPLVATCYNDLPLISRLAIQLTDRVLKGEQVPLITNVDSPLITAQNIPGADELPSGTITPFFQGA